MQDRITARVRRAIMAVLIASPVVVVVVIESSHAKLIVAGRADNDLVKLLGERATRVDAPAEAIERAGDADGVLVLADDYPKTRVALPPASFELAGRKRLRLYIEYPADVPGLKLGDARAAVWERGVVSSGLFGDALRPMRIVAPHDCRFIAADVRPPDAHLCIARVAGYDTAVYGLPDNAAPLLFETRDGRWLVATSKLSHFVTARFAPTAEWKHVWRTILRKLDPDREPPTLDHAPLVRPSGSTDERQAFERHAAFYLRGGLLVTPRRRDEIHRLLREEKEGADPPRAAADGDAVTVGDGTLGMAEGFASHIRFDSTQPMRTPIRADCNAEAAMVLSLSRDPRHRQIAANLLDYTFGPEMQSLGRLDAAHPAFGLIAWGAVAPAWQVANYGDDNARVLLAAILASAALETNRWDEPILRALVANLRTTGTRGFRGDRIDVPALEQHGWRHYREADTVNFSPHFESALWACYLWAYARTGDREFLDRTTAAIRLTMDAYAKQQWRWNDNIERSRMLLCLAWLARADDAPPHRAWLATIAGDLLRDRHACGAIPDRLMNGGGGHYQVPRSNEAYGTSETPLIQANGDPVSDQLYTNGFALLGLREAAAATGDATLRAAEDELAAYLCRIQIRSDARPELDGAWFRAFDFGRWDYWASSADLGWGAWSVEAGWGPAWTAATLALRERRTSVWEMTAASRIKEQVPRVRADMAKNDGRPLRATAR